VLQKFNVLDLGYGKFLLFCTPYVAKNRLVFTNKTQAKKLEICQDFLALYPLAARKDDK
jgi:hypothetical protein